ncbi:hypothetical protein [Pedobacter sp. N23S346]|uniref:hypothetical protein n=1 Tax=Pedobacter sp. N23S346 TaxID=3402750 RepID=UPI003AD46EE9
MKPLLTYFLFFLIFSSAAAQSIPTKLDSLIDAYASLNKLNGNIMITRDGQHVFEGSYGYRDIEKEKQTIGR